MNLPRTLRFYRPSGSLNLGVVLWIGIGAAAAALLAGIYDLVQLIPLVYVSLLAAFGFAWALGLIETFIIRRGHIRNRSFAIMSALAVGGFGLLASYWWGYRRFIGEVAEAEPGTSVMDLLFNQGAFLRWIELKVEAGWTVKSAEINGVMVYAVWAVEAAIVFGYVLYMAYDASSAPYCEKCKAWGISRELRVDGVGKEEAQPLLEKGDLAGVISLAEVPGKGAEKKVWLEHHTCPMCRVPSYLTVGTITYKAGKNGPEEVKKALVKYVTLSPELTHQLNDRFAAAEGLAPVVEPAEVKAG